MGPVACTMLDFPLLGEGFLVLFCFSVHCSGSVCRTIFASAISPHAAIKRCNNLTIFQE